MSGVDYPDFPITEAFGLLATAPADITLPIPVPTQTGILVGAASFADGFPPVTRTDPALGGVAPYGQDMNGILYMLSQYAALVQGGQWPPFNAAVAAAIAGYFPGAKVASVSVPGRIWTNNLAGNAADPDTTPANWVADRPLYLAIAPGAGQINNYALPGASDFCIDVNTAAGAVDFSGFVPQRDGQKLFISSTGANLLQVLASNAGSTAANRVRAATDVAAVQNQTITLQYCEAVTKWLLV